MNLLGNQDSSYFIIRYLSFQSQFSSKSISNFGIEFKYTSWLFFLSKKLIFCMPNNFKFYLFYLFVYYYILSLLKLYYY